MLLCSVTLLLLIKNEPTMKKTPLQDLMSIVEIFKFFYKAK